MVHLLENFFPHGSYWPWAGEHRKLADDLVPFEVACSPEPFTADLADEGWGKVHSEVAEEDLLAGGLLEAEGARH